MRWVEGNEMKEFFRNEKGGYSFNFNNFKFL